MSLHAVEPEPVPALTAEVARAAFPHGCLAMRIRDVLGPVFRDADFADLFPRRGQPAWSPGRLALVLVLQFVEHLSDRQAAVAVRDRIAWKYLLGLELTDPGFDFSVLSEFRTRLVAGSLEHRLLIAVLEACRRADLLGPGAAARTDSTHVLGAVRELNRLELIGETMRAALNALAVAAPRWLSAWLPDEWIDRYGHRVENYRLPQTIPERDVWTRQVGADGALLLAQVGAHTAPDWLAGIDAVAILRRVWGQQFSCDGGELRFRPTGQLPPSAERICSPYDTECRYGVKRLMRWTGFKAHLTEHCQDGAPHLVIDCAVTTAATSDQGMVEKAHDRLAATNLLPKRHLVDTGYMSAEAVLTEAADHRVRLIGPMPPDTSWQATARHGYALADFTIDWANRTATCPQGAIATGWREMLDNRGHPVIRIRFRDHDCLTCPARASCTRRATEPRDIIVRPRHEHELLQHQRVHQHTEPWKAEYAQRAGIEGTLAQAIRVSALRRCRYRGMAKTHLQAELTAAALNLIRIDAWLTHTPLACTRTARFARNDGTP